MTGNITLTLVVTVGYVTIVLDKPMFFGSAKLRAYRVSETGTEIDKQFS